MQQDSTNTFFELATRFVQNTNRNIFLTGKAGTGKTTFLKFVRERCNKKLAVVAPTGVAAINAGGVTIHTFFQLPLGGYVPAGIVPDSEEQLFNNRQTLLRNLRLSQPKRELMRELELLVIDEVSMLRSDILDAIDTILRHVRKKPLLPFGGVQVLFIGDLFQLPPVIADKEWHFLREFYNSPFFFDAVVLKNSVPVFLELKKIYRQNEQAFINLLNKVRNNLLDQEDFQFLNSRFNPGYQPDPADQFITLSTHNARADSINQQALSKLEGDSYRYKAEIWGDFSEKAYPADEELVLKVGAQVMFIKNDKGEERRFYNGRIATVHALAEEHIVVKFSGEEDELELEREVWRNIRYQYNKAKDSIEEEELGTFSQFPVRLAWAITIHKSQGLTFEKAIIDAGSAFAPGQVYVALSRLTNFEGMVLRSPIRANAIQTDQRVRLYHSEEKTPLALEEELTAAEQDFIQSSLLKAFQLDNLKEQSEQWVQEMEKKTGDKIKAHEWALQFREKVGQLIPIANKTIVHLEHLIRTTSPDGYDRLEERTSAAVNYFIALIAHILDDLKQHVEEVKKESRVKKYLREIGSIESSLKMRIEQLKRSEQLTKALVAGEKITDLLEIISSKLAVEPGEAEADSEINSTKTKEEQAVRIKGESQRTSLDLFSAGKSIAEIAKERGLAISTIEGHLSRFVANGELPIENLISSEKLLIIEEAITRAENRQVNPIKDALGADFSYAEIRAVFAHLEYKSAQQLSN